MTDNVMTPEGRVSFPNVFRVGKAMNVGEEGKYSVTLLFKKGETLDGLKAAAHAVLVEKFGTPDKFPKNLRSPFRDQGDKEFEGYEAGAIFITATSKQRPGLVDHNVNDIIEEREFYPGCYARISVRPFYYDQKGNRGVAFGLQNIQKLRDGDPLGGRSRASDDFEPVTQDKAGEGSAASTVFG